MKRLLPAILFFATVCSAQDYVKPYSPNYTRPYQTYKDSLHASKWFLSFSFGISMPLSDYGTKDTAHNFMVIGPDSTNGKGYANLGIHANMSGGVFLGPHYGLCAKIAFNENTFDQSTLNITINGNYSYTINDNYQIWQFMGGVFGHFKTNATTFVWVQGMIGLINANFPSFSIYNLPAKQFPPYLTWNFTLPEANDFAYPFSLGFEKVIYRNLSFLTTLSYTGSELVYPTLTYDFSGPYSGLPPAHTQNTPVTMSFGSFDFSVGVLFHL